MHKIVDDRPDVKISLKTVVALILLSILVTSIFFYSVYSPDLTYDTTLEQGSMNIGCSYLVLEDNSIFYARNGATGAIDFEGTNRTALIESCISAIGANNGTIILKNDVNFYPNQTAYDNNIIIQYEDGTSIYEEWYYKLLVAATSPSLIHMAFGSFNFTPTETIYSTFKDYVVYGALHTNPITNYVISEAPGSPLLTINRHTTAEGYIADNGASVGSFIFVNETDVNNIPNAKALWFRRMNWLMNTSPTRIAVQNVPQYYDDFRYNTTISLGTYGSFITTLYDAAWETKIMCETGGVISYPAGSHTYAWDDVLGNNQGAGMGWKMCNLFMPINATIDGDAYTWYLGVRGVDVGIGWTSYALIEKYDVPVWWDDF